MWWKEDYQNMLAEWNEHKGYPGELTNSQSEMEEGWFKGEWWRGRVQLRHNVNVTMYSQYNNMIVK
jgi:hypothetical protein